MTTARLTVLALLACLTASTASAQEPVDLRLRLDSAQDEASQIDLAVPAILTASGGAAVIAGVVVALSGAPNCSSGFGSLGGGGCSQGNDAMMGGGIALAIVGALTLIPSAIWLGVDHARQRRLDREIRTLRVRMSLSPSNAGLMLDGSF